MEVPEHPDNPVRKFRRLNDIKTVQFSARDSILNLRKHHQTYHLSITSSLLGPYIALCVAYIGITLTYNSDSAYRYTYLIIGLLTLLVTLIFSIDRYLRSRRALKAAESSLAHLIDIEPLVIELDDTETANDQIMLSFTLRKALNENHSISFREATSRLTFNHERKVGK